MMSLWDALRMNMMISYQELVRTFPRSRSLQQAQINKNLCNHYKEQIQQWITLIEYYEGSLSKYEKVKRFVGKHKWFFVIATTVIAKSYVAYDVIEGWISKIV
ncbi:Uncharacterised protein [Klebsiella pneumoniae]|nr:Uncharacterised protein [Klebsiella pneumoniae]